MTIIYIKGEDNTVVDTLSRIEPETFQNEKELPVLAAWGLLSSSILKIEADTVMLKSIQEGYKTDKFCKRIRENLGSIPGATEVNELLYIGSQLIIPQVTEIRENLF
jgi:hypothetical protein